MVIEPRPEDYDRLASVNASHSMNIYMALGTTCNLDCHYCPQHVHDGQEPWHDFDKLLAVLQQIRHHYRWKRSRHYNLLGGEPSLMPRLPELCERIKQMDDASRIILATNGTRTVKFWQRIAPYIDQILCSVHVRQIDIQQLNAGFKALVESGVHVAANVLMDIHHWDKAVATADYLTQNGWCHYITMKPVETMLGSNQLQPYTDDQRRVIQEWGEDRQYARQSACNALYPHELHMDEDVYRWQTADGRYSQLNNFQAVSRDWDKLKGWHCFINADKMSIQPFGQVASGDTCDQGVVLGNFYESDPTTWDWTMAPVICQRERCVCGGDLDTHKFKNQTDAEAYAAVICQRISDADRRSVLD